MSDTRSVIFKNPELWDKAQDIADRLTPRSTRQAVLGAAIQRGLDEIDAEIEDPEAEDPETEEQD